MALRLTDPVTTAAPVAPAPAAPPAVGLCARAQALLASGDVAGYGALFAEAAEIADVHRRYEARVRLLETGLATRGATAAVVGPVFAAVADAALRLIEDEPREPVVVNLAAVALYELGGAERLFRAARTLDPDLPHVERNLAEIRRRRSAGLDGALALPPMVTVRLKGLADRARRAAPRARPATGLTLSLCMIVKDEEAMLGACLDAVRDHVDEIVVVDTGSTDRTVEIAAERGARVLHHAWTGDFAEARNVSFDAATSDWIVYLDADEVLVEGDGPRLRALTGRTWREAFHLTETNHTGRLEDGTAVTHNALRVFRNRPEYPFEGRIDHDAAGDALTRAREAQLGDAELQVLDGWRGLLAGGSGPALLPAASAAPLFTMLEALLRVVDVDAFAAAVPLADALAIPDRERRERLAQMYLRRGFLESAADEWIA